MLIESSSLTDRVAHELTQRIQQGTYPVGEKLPAGRLLAQEFQVSAAVIREATERLRTKGLVRTRQGAGCTVLARSSPGFHMALPEIPDRQALLHIYELRLEIEGGAAALAAVRATADDLHEMHAILQALHDSLHQPGPALEWDIKFHLCLARASHNPHYSGLLHYLNDQWRQSVAVARRHTQALDAVHGAPGKSPGSPAEQALSLPLSRRVHEEHVAVFTAIQSRNPEAARQCAQAHLRNAAQRLGLVLSCADALPDTPGCHSPAVAALARDVVNEDASVALSRQVLGSS
jgi:DNA-binding FadR family transcriptional regulator